MGKPGKQSLNPEMATEEEVLSIVTNSTVNGRLTLTSGSPVVTSADESDKTSLYFTPYIGDFISLYDGTFWHLRHFTELSISNSGFTANTPHDIFCYDDNGTPTLEKLAWASTATRATALVYQDGVLSKSGATTRRYIGTVHVDAASKFQNTNAKRFVYNYYNKILVISSQQDTTASWTYNSSTPAAANGGNANWKHEFVVGITENTHDCTAFVQTTGGNPGPTRWSIGVDRADGPDGTQEDCGNSYVIALTSQLFWLPTIGYHYTNAVHSVDSGTATFYGNLPSMFTNRSWR